MPDDLPTFDNPRGWTWRNDLDVPSQLHVEPAFLDHLGAVFVRIDQQGRHLGIWLTEDVMGQFIAAMRAAAEPAGGGTLPASEPTLVAENATPNCTAPSKRPRMTDGCGPQHTFTGSCELADWGSRGQA